MNYRKTLNACFAAAAVGLEACAHADLTVTTTVTTLSGGIVAASSLPAAGTYTTYYHDEMARTDLPNGVSWLFDYQNQQVATIHSATRTYSIQTLSAFLAGSKASLHSASSFTTSVSASNQAQKTISGMIGTPYSFSTQPLLVWGGASLNGSAYARMPRSATLMGRRSTSSTSSSSSGAPVVSGVSGTVWMTPASQDLNSVDTSLPLFCIAFQGNSALASLSGRLQQMGAVPILIEASFGKSNASSSSSGLAKVECTVSQVSTNALSANLFVLPSGYTQNQSN